MSTLGQRLIAENRSSKAVFLDLGNCGLSEIPDEIGDLVWLKGLSLASNWYEWKSENGQRKTSANKGRRNSITNLESLAPLSGLQALALSKTQVADLRPIAQLRALQSLDISDTPVADLSPLANLSRLQMLDLTGTLVDNLGPLVRLSGLRRLDASNSQVGDLSPLVALISGGCQVKWSSESWEGDGIYVGECPLTNPPAEVVAQGNEAILNYFAATAQGGGEHLFEAKVVVLGEAGAGKTSLIKSLLQTGRISQTVKATQGISIHKHEFRMKNGRTFRLSFWEFGGQAIYHAIHQFFLTERTLYVLVEDARRENTLASDGGLRYWLELIEVFGGHSSVLIFQNERGGRRKPIDFKGIKKRYANVLELYAGDLSLPNATDKIRESIEFNAQSLGHVGELLPASWIKVREEIETLSTSKPYISIETYFEIFSKHTKFDEAKALLLSRYFHDLGVFLHFQDDLLLRRTIILQKEWVTNAVFRILEDRAIREKHGRFDQAAYARVWKDSAYPWMHPELLALMQNFDLCYRLEDSEPPTWLVPELLPESRPEGLKMWAKPEDLVLRYRYEFLPKGITTRLVARLHQFVKDPDQAWTAGALFQNDGARVSVELISGGEIELRARGPERKAFLSVVASELDTLNESFKGLRHRISKRIPCRCESCRKVSIPHFFDQKALLRRQEHGATVVLCDHSFEEVSVVELLDGVRTERPHVSTSQSKVTHRKYPYTIRLFLASSSELRDDRDQFHLYFSKQNDRLIKRGAYLEIVRWEYFFDAMSETRLQDEYNKAIRDCDIFVSLFFTKAGKFTEEEIDVAVRVFKERGRPRVFTFFKSALVNIDSLLEEDFGSLRAFQRKLRELGHFYTRYENTHDLKLQFRDQLDMFIDQNLPLLPLSDAGNEGI